jgi:antitoxin component YwqK of YwqJK toxin-antitoxin module
MKIRRFVLIPGLLIVLATVVSAQKPDKDKKIRSIIVYQEKYDNLISKKYKELEQYYDSRGNLLEEITYKQGKITTHFKYEYDSDDNKNREEEFDPSGKMIEFSEYIYENGLRIEKTVYYPNRKIKSKKIYQYTTF